MTDTATDQQLDTYSGFGCPDAMHFSVMFLPTTNGTILAGCSNIDGGMSPVTKKQLVIDASHQVTVKRSRSVDSFWRWKKLVETGKGKVTS